MQWLVDVALRWYSFISSVSAVVGEPIQQLMGSQNSAGISALLLGLLGGLAPCQMTANASTIAYVTQNGPNRRSLWGTVGNFIAGKAAVYLLFGFLAAMLGLRIPTPVLAILRKLSGPLMIVVGLYMIGLFRLSGGTGSRVTEWLRERAPGRGHPAFWLGAAFSLGFCPTMALIFFGALVPIIVESQAGIFMPILFAAGTAAPVIIWALALSAGQGLAGRWVRGVRNSDRYVRWVAAAVFMIAGLNDTVLYWLV